MPRWIAGQQPRTLRREPDRAAVPHEQRRFQELFERLDVRADRRGRDVERLRGAGETQVGSDGFERAQRVQRQFRGLMSSFNIF